MAFVVKDRIQETTTTTGTGPLVLSGAVTGFKTFSSVMSNGDYTYYSCVNASGSEWEVGYGQYISGTNSIARGTIFASSTGGYVNFSAGTKNIFITYAAPRAMATNMMSSTGGLLSRDSTGNPYDVTIGSTGQVLTVNAFGYPGWANAPVGTAFSTSSTTNYISQYSPVALNKLGQVELVTTFNATNSSSFSSAYGYNQFQGESYSTRDGTPIFVGSWDGGFTVQAQMGRVNGSGTSSYYGWSPSGTYYTPYDIVPFASPQNWISVAWDPKTDYGVAIYCNSSNQLQLVNFSADTNNYGGAIGTFSNKGQATLASDCSITGIFGWKASIVYDPYSDTMLVAYVDTSYNIKVIAVGRGYYGNWGSVNTTVTIGTTNGLGGGSICGAFDYQNGGAAFAIADNNIGTIKFFAAKGDLNSIDYSINGYYGANTLIYSGLSESIGQSSSSFPLSNQSWAFNKRVGGLIFATKLVSATRPGFSLVKSNGASVAFSSQFALFQTAFNNYDTCVIVCGQEDYAVFISMEDSTGAVSYLPLEISLGGDIIANGAVSTFSTFSNGAYPSYGRGLGVAYGPLNQGIPIYPYIFSSLQPGSGYLNVMHANTVSFIGFSQSAVGASSTTSVVFDTGLSETTSSSLVAGQTFYLGWTPMGGVYFYPAAYSPSGFSTNNGILVGIGQSTSSILVTNSPGLDTPIQLQILPVPNFGNTSTINTRRAVSATSGTSIDFTGIPSWVKRITVMLNAVSVSGTANIWLQIGAGSIEITGYTTNAGRVSGTSCTTFAPISTAFLVSSTSAATDTHTGTLILTTLGSNAWTFTGTCLNPNGPMMHYLAGVKTTSGTLDRVRVTTSTGTDTFDAGTINILYE